MSVAVLIPARYASTRYPGKPLAEIDTPDGRSKPLIQLTWEAARAVAGVSEIHVLTDDDRIREAAITFGASVLMTSPTCRNGTERCAEAAPKVEADILVNLQGDAPLTPPWFIEALIDTLRTHSDVDVATPVLRCDADSYARFVDDRKHGHVGATTAVFADSSDALYFSKEVLPWIDPRRVPDPIPVWHHVGVYAYRRMALEAYAGRDEGTLERLEGLEQLRFLEHGWKVRCVPVDARGREFWELNNPHDVARIEAALRGRA